MISVIIRTRNEERWIRTCLEAVLRQQVDQPVEVVLVDNASTDRTVERARQVCPEIKVVNVRNFLPGLAINEGVVVASGDLLVCLSAHCVPVNEHWLASLASNLTGPDIAGVYGRQTPTAFTSAVDKRDLLLTFGPERREQRIDSFFHNANSMFSRAIWEKIPFDSNVTNIEDRVWGKAVIEAGYRIIYEPDAAVYHYHGIHQDNRPDRAENVVRIMESLTPADESATGNPFDPMALDVVAIVPVRRHKADVDADLNDRLVQDAIHCAKGCRYVKRVVVSTDDPEVATKVIGWGAEAPFIRPPELSAATVRVDEVLRYTLERLEAAETYPDVLLSLEVTYPFRTSAILDGLIEQLLREGLDSVMAGYAEHRPCWLQDERGVTPLSKHDQHRSERKPVHVGLISLGCATYPQSVRQGHRLGERVGIYEIHDPFATIEVRDAATMRLLDAYRG